MGKIIDLTGQRFGKLVVISLDCVDKKKGAYWLCQCDCGEETITLTNSLRSGNTKSCGCLQKELFAEFSNNKFIDLTGKRFGNLVVIERAKNKNNCVQWLCQCDCGNTKITGSSSLQSGGTKSCGCCKNKLDYGEASCNNLYKTYMDGARKRGYEFSISIDVFKKITKQNCFYCGGEPRQIRVANKRYNGNYIYNGIDRVDNSIGYTGNNVVACCNFCNHMKHTMPQQEFLNHIEKIHNYQKEKNENKPSSTNLY